MSGYLAIMLKGNASTNLQDGKTIHSDFTKNIICQAPSLSLLSVELIIFAVGGATGLKIFFASLKLSKRSSKIGSRCTLRQNFQFLKFGDIILQTLL